jgi:predicted ATP-grasp superfamily ATP-dependent carboligase
MEDKQESHIIQQYQVGVAASISMLCHSEKAIVLSCNQQKVALKDGQFEYQGSVVNGMIAHREAFELLASKIASSLPGLAGFVGVDLIVHPDKDAWCYNVLEINPRLTTSYVGLHQACGMNPAQLILDMFYNGHQQMPTILFNKIDVSTHVTKSL